MRFRIARKTGPRRAILSVLLAFACCAPAAALDLRLEARGLTLGPLNADAAELDYVAGRLDLRGLRHPEFGELGTLVLDCPAAPCANGILVWRGTGDSTLELPFQRHGAELRLTGPTISGTLVRSEAGIELALEEVQLGPLNALLPAELGLRALDGQASVIGGLHTGDDGIEGVDLRLGVSGLGFDTASGQHAAAGVDADLQLNAGLADRDLDLTLNWTAGEILSGPVYLAPPEASLMLALGATAGPEGCDWRIERARLEQEGVIDAGGDGALNLCESPRLDRLTLGLTHLDLESVWTGALQSVASAYGWGDLSPSGRMVGRVSLNRDRVIDAQVRLLDAGLDDARGRIGVEGLTGALVWQSDTSEFDAHARWSGARLFRIPLGASSLGLVSAIGDAGTPDLRLSETFRLPVLDGALIVDRLQWRDWRQQSRELNVDLRLEPLNLAELTRTLGWPEFGGTISGRLPGLRLTRDGVVFDGALDVNLFDGSARIDGLAMERPFGTLPAVAAEIEIESLDLELVTGAFEFGHMQGRMSGYLRDLRLLDWQPVRFDAWFQTLDDAGTRRISQQAVDSLSSLGGGGSAALSGTLLKVFDDFPYRRVGLGCRLENNICRMRGLEPADDGGYLIVEGRPFPVLNVVGHQKRVDWPRLLAQLAAVTAAPAPKATD